MHLVLCICQHSKASQGFWLYKIPCERFLTHLVAYVLAISLNPSYCWVSADSITSITISVLAFVISELFCCFSELHHKYFNIHLNPCNRLIVLLLFLLHHKYFHIRLSPCKKPIVLLLFLLHHKYFDIDSIKKISIVIFSSFPTPDAEVAALTSTRPLSTYRPLRPRSASPVLYRPTFRERYGLYPYTSAYYRYLSDRVRWPSLYYPYTTSYLTVSVVALFLFHSLVAFGIGMACVLYQT